MAQKNLLHGNPQHHETLGWLLGQRADVIVVEELTDRWRHALLSGLIGYRPFLPPRPAGEWHTVGVFVRDGLEVTSHRFWGEAEPLKPMVEVVLEAGFDEPVTVVGVHTRSPVSADWARRRDHQLTELAAWSRGHGGPLVIAGDLNATRWSAPMRAWSRAGRLRDTAEGAGLWGTWPGFWAWSGMITLDHVLVSAHFANGRRRIGPGLGSDHRGVMVELMPAVLARPAG